MNVYQTPRLALQLLLQPAHHAKSLLDFFGLLVALELS